MQETEENFGKNNLTSRAKSHSAAGPNAGFGYQFERALNWLAKSPSGSVIGVETDDDVAVRYATGLKILEQDKHSVRKNAKPFGDRSKDLWNTLATWMEAVEAGTVCCESAKFLMVTNKTLPDRLAHRISRAKSDAEIAGCIRELTAAARKPPANIAALTARVLRPASLKTLQGLILKSELIDGEGNDGAELRQDTCAQLQIPVWCSEHVNSIANELFGWLHTTVTESWRLRKPAWVSRDHFVNELHAIVDRRKRQLTRERAEYLIPVTDANVGQERARPFVKQLHLVTDDEALVDCAIRDYIRCNIEKSRLSEEGNITDGDWMDFESALYSRWQKIFARNIRIKKADKDEDIGFTIFTDTTEDHCQKLAGSDTEQVYLTSGSYHRLADMIRIGWHPDFKKHMG